MKTRTGKIARLPRALRDQLNCRLDDGDSGQSLVDWLNALPEVRQCLAEHFAGRPISEQNLSEWKAGGFQQWLDQQAALELAGRLTENDDELGEVTDDLLTDKMSTWVAARYLMTMQKLQLAGDDAEASLKRLRPLCRDVAMLRRGDLQADRLQLDRDKYEHAKLDDNARSLKWTLDEAHKYPDVIAQFKKAYSMLCKRRGQPDPYNETESSSEKPKRQRRRTPPKAPEPAAGNQTQSDPIKPLTPVGETPVAALQPNPTQSDLIKPKNPRPRTQPQAPKPPVPPASSEQDAATSFRPSSPLSPLSPNPGESNPIKPTTPAKTAETPSETPETAGETPANPTQSDPIQPALPCQPGPDPAKEDYIRWHRMRYRMQIGAEPYDPERLANLYAATPID